MALLLRAVPVCAFDPTLRVDYVFTGGRGTASIALVRMSVTEGWYGRSVNLDKLIVPGHGQIRLTDDATGKTIYLNSFSTLYQEWLATPEAKTTIKSFENTYLLPMPEGKATIQVCLQNVIGDTICTYAHKVVPTDILIAHKQASDIPAKYIHKGGDPKQCIDVAIVGEGYTARERKLFFRDAQATVDALFSHEPFKHHQKDFNFVAIVPASKQSGVSLPRKNDWRTTPFGSHFDTFYSARYLTIEQLSCVHDALDGLPYEHLIILANTDTYGGGGIYGSYAMGTSDNELSDVVFVHEFGHSFAGLGDEYYDSSTAYQDFYPAGVEPWEPNITTCVDFDSKWKDMIEEATPVPTPNDPEKYYGIVGLFEGAGYMTKGCWRPYYECRMLNNTAPAFCPVCQRAIEAMIDFYVN